MFVLVYAALLVGWALAYRIWGDRWWWLALLNTFAVWLFLPAPVMILIAAWDPQPAEWAGIAIIIVLWVALFGWRFLPPGIRRARLPGLAALGNRSGATTPGADQRLVLRVMAFNVLYTNREVERLAAAIEAGEADLIALPELRPKTDALLAACLGARYPYRLIATLPGARFGTGIYSRWPLQDRGSLKTGLGLRSAVADVETPKGIVRLVAVHPQATLADLRSFKAFCYNVVKSFRGREHQVQAVCRYLDTWHGEGGPPLILAGDFNMCELSDAYRCLAGRLEDAHRSAGWGLGHTWPSRTNNVSPSRNLPIFVPLARIDFVFHSDHWSALGARTISVPTGSDHRPVLVKLQLKCTEQSYGKV